jgi:immunity protein 8 of polymorphic toxin system
MDRHRLRTTFEEVPELWDYAVVSRAIHDLCSQHEGSMWSEVAEKIARYGYWEFEDYREEP